MFCVLCGNPAESGLSIPTYEGKIVNIAESSEWGGSPACQTCFDQQVAIPQPAPSPLTRQQISSMINDLSIDLEAGETAGNTAMVTRIITCLSLLGMAVDQEKEGQAGQALFDVMNNRYRPSVTQLNIVTAE